MLIALWFKFLIISIHLKLSYYLLTLKPIVKITKLSQPNTSLHLACLLESGLVSKIEKGREVFYKVSMKEITSLINQTKKIIRKHSKNIYKCTHYMVIVLIIIAFAALGE